MRRDIPGIVISACRHYGALKFKIIRGGDGEHVDGYAQSLLGRIREERDGASQGEVKQYFPEVYWGLAQDVFRSLPGMPYRVRVVGELHYVIPGDVMTVIQKAAALGMTKPEYFRELENFEVWIWARLDSVTDCVLNKKPLQLIPKSNSVRVTSAKLAKVSPPDFDFSALKRRKISLVS